MPEIVVYGPLRNPFVGKVLCALTLKKLEHEVVEPSDPSDYRRLNPETGLLPVADIDGKRVADSHRILDAIDARWPEPPLVSPDPKIAAAQRQLERWSSETFVFYWERFLRQRMEEGAAGESEDRALARFGIFRRQPLVSTGSRYAAEYAQRVADLANFLGSRPFFYADRISRADLAAYSFLSTGRVGAIRDTVVALEQHPTLREWMDRVAEQTRAASMP
ncbi:MAG TPA: glutathione S-transferase family protein [Myxococcota bacterium]|nr:glutathione S-transferase family protein [Myxococcota bacterium]